MNGETGVVVRRRGRGEIERLVVLYRSSGMGRSEFCRSHGMALSTLDRYVKKQQNEQRQAGSNSFEGSRLVPVELAAAMPSIAAGELCNSPMVVLINSRRIEVRRGFDAETLAQVVTVLERL